jgi:hypothetical protein
MIVFFKINAFYGSLHGLQTHDGYIPDSLRPKFKSQSQINIWYLDIKAYALSFYEFKMILAFPNHFGRIPIALDVFNLFWLGPNPFGQVQIKTNCPEKSDLNLIKMIWTQPKRFGHNQNNLYPSQTIWAYRRTRH